MITNQVKDFEGYLYPLISNF